MSRLSREHAPPTFLISQAYTAVTMFTVLCSQLMVLYHIQLGTK